MPTVWTSKNEPEVQRVKWSDVSAKLPMKEARQSTFSTRRRYFVAPEGVVDVTFSKRQLPPDEVFESVLAMEASGDRWSSLLRFWRRS